jgi:hypothetical protein
MVERSTVGGDGMTHVGYQDSHPEQATVSEAAVWVVAAALVGFAVPAVFSSWLHWDRTLFLVPYLAIAGIFLAVFFRRAGVTWSTFARAWPYGLAGAAIFGFIVVQNVFGQPASATPGGAQLVWALIWFGVVYGVIDALFLNVLPVLAVQGAGFWDSRPTWSQLLVRGLLGLAASAIIAGAYHFGFSEFRGVSLLLPIFGNVVITLSFVLTRSPLAPIGAHVAMHIAGVLHGMETVVQLPPHY